MSRAIGSFYLFFFPGTYSIDGQENDSFEMKQFMKTHAGRVEEPGCNLHDVSSPISTAAVHVTVCPKTN
jgi:hypothetical protein